MSRKAEILPIYANFEMYALLCTNFQYLHRIGYKYDKIYVWLGVNVKIYVYLDGNVRDWCPVR